MKVGLIITTYNRPEYLERCLKSVMAAITEHERTLDLGIVLNGKDYSHVWVYVVDDASTDHSVNMIITQELRGMFVTSQFNSRNVGIARNLLNGFWKAWDDGCDIVMNLDADAVVRPTFIRELLKLSVEHPNNIVTGFHSVNRNADGKERHKVMERHEGYWIKESVGGINFVLNKKLYESYVKPALSLAAQKKCNWDHKACQLSMSSGNGIVCAVPSLIQHIGIESSMGHTSNEQPDVAADWHDLELPDVTLIGVDCNHVELLQRAFDLSTVRIKFGAEKILTSKDISDARAYMIEDLTTKEAYNEFIVRELYKFVDTKYLLIIQHDGYVLNWEGWDPKFLEWDYIGATWWYKDGLNVGNGGFSLRSKAFMKAVAEDELIVETYPEDHQLCRTYRRHIEKAHGMKYAPAEVADRFAIEAAYTADNGYKGQFGFHGYGVDYTAWAGKLDHIPKKELPKRVGIIAGKKNTGLGYKMIKR